MQIVRSGLGTFVARVILFAIGLLGMATFWYLYYSLGLPFMTLVWKYNPATFPLMYLMGDEISSWFGLLIWIIIGLGILEFNGAVLKEWARYCFQEFPNDWKEKSRLELEQQLLRQKQREEQERAKKESQIKLEQEQEKARRAQLRLEDLTRGSTPETESDYRLLFPNACPKCLSRNVVAKQGFRCDISALAEKLLTKPPNDMRMCVWRCARCDCRPFDVEGQYEVSRVEARPMYWDHYDEWVLDAEGAAKLGIPLDSPDRYVQHVYYIRILSPYLTKEQSESIPEWSWPAAQLESAGIRKPVT